MLDGRPPESWASRRTRSKPLSAPRSISTSVRSGWSCAACSSASLLEEATPTTRIPSRSRSSLAAARKPGLSSTMRHRKAIAMRMSAEGSADIAGSCNLLGLRRRHLVDEALCLRGPVGVYLDLVAVGAGLGHRREVTPAAPRVVGDRAPQRAPHDALARPRHRRPSRGHPPRDLL